MKRKITIALLLVISGLMFITSCKKDDDDSNDDNNTPTIDPAKQAVIDDYNNLYLASTVSNCGWTGSTTSCTAGATSADALSKTLQRINYYRKQVGLNYDITFDTDKNTKCQEAALMMDANNDLDHYPPTSWSCYTADGSTAAGSSNLALGCHTSSAIDLYMEDPGSSNTACGHRRWILYSRSKIMGSGSTSGANALWVLGNSGNPLPTGMPEFISWPPEGYVCAPLVFARWSLSVPSADFSSATVSMTDASGNAISCSVISNTANGYGDNTIVWEPTGINTSSASDVTYHVNVNNVTVSSTTKNYSYDVVIIQP